MNIIYHWQSDQLIFTFFYILVAFSTIEMFSEVFVLFDKLNSLNNVSGLVGAFDIIDGAYLLKNRDDWLKPPNLLWGVAKFFLSICIFGFLSEFKIWDPALKFLLGNTNDDDLW